MPNDENIAGILNYYMKTQCPIADDMDDFFDVLALALQLPSISIHLSLLDREQHTI